MFNEDGQKEGEVEHVVPTEMRCSGELLHDCRILMSDFEFWSTGVSRWSTIAEF